MDAANIYIIVGSISVSTASVLLNFAGRQRYKDNASFFESSNHELREQNTALRAENSEFRAELAKVQAESSQKDQTIEQLKPFSEVVKTMSDNHTAVMEALASVTKKITGKVDGRPKSHN